MNPLPNNTEETIDVLIVGAGPCGLMLANELGRRGVRALVVDEKDGTAVNPQANATQARTMEHYRRLGFAHEVRAQGLPPTYPTDIAYFTRYTGHELARYALPASGQASRVVQHLSGSWSAAELPHRVSQKFVEQVLRRHAETLPGIELRFGWRMRSFEDLGSHVRATLEPVGSGAAHQVTAQYLVGADGPRSSVRQALGLGYTGEAGVRRDFMGGRMHAIHLHAPDFYQRVPHGQAWMYCAFNRDRRSFMAAVDGQGQFAFHTQLKEQEQERDITDEVARQMFAQAFGAPLDIDILSRRSWTAGFALVAEHFQRGRVFIGGDAAHLFTPAGGLGYNTAIEDAVNLGWKLAAVITGQAPPALLDSYERERRPVAVRNTGYARQFADSMGLFAPDPALEEDTRAGAAAREAAGTYLNRHIRTEFNIPGVTFGARYDESPIIVPDGTHPPPDAANSYTPSACPGGRAPHLWLGEDRSLYDAFGFHWTLLCTRPTPDLAEAFRQAAARRSLPLTLLTVDRPDLRDLYEADAALIRPDQVVGWRSGGVNAAPLTPAEVLQFVLGGSSA